MRHVRIGATAGALLAASMTLQACLVAPESSPRVWLGVDVATQYNVRGTPMVKTGVVQPESEVVLPTKDGGALSFSAWGNLNLQDDVGNAWFPDGAAGEFSELDFSARYSRTFGSTAATLAVTNYTLTQGSEFVLGPAQSVRGSTNEASLTLEQRDLFLKLTPRFELHYDYDEVDDFYLRAGLSRTFVLSERWFVDLDAWQGWMGDEQALWFVGVTESGLADLGGQATLRWRVLPNCDLSLFVAGTTLIDDAYRDWFDLLSDSGLEISPDNLWGGIGVKWNY